MDNEPLTTNQLMHIDHIGFATREIEQALSLWRDTLGLKVKSTEDVAEQGVRVAMLPIGESQIELLEPLHPDSPVGKFLEQRGPGIHHVAIRVQDIQAALAQLKEKGTRLIDETPRLGAGGCLVAFIHPSSTNGVLLELVQHQ
ncbi:MAG: methylmalonyl-CoA epimerase [Pyrinomonadaceae bacterium]